MNASEQFCSDYTLNRDHLAGQQLPWLAVLRDTAFATFTRQGLPGPRTEDWKYTRLTSLEQLAFVRAGRADIDALPAWLKGSLLFGSKSLKGSLPACQNGHRLVFINGWYMPELSSAEQLPAGLELCSFAEALTRHSTILAPMLGSIVNCEEQPFAALNSAFMEDGLFVRVAADTVIEQPLHCLFLSAPMTGKDSEAAAPLVSYPRLFILLEDNAELSLVEHYVSSESLAIENPAAGLDINSPAAAAPENHHLTNSLTEILLQPHARLQHYKLQCESSGASHIAGIHVEQRRASRFVSHNLSLGAALARNDIRVKLAEPEARCCLNGVYLVTDRQHVDHHTQVDHLAANCTSEELYKGVIGGRARAVFNGKVVVHRDAQQSDARQINKNLLLTEKAEVDTKPELQIYADDAKCTHGATVGQLDAEALFYLQSRGISQADAQALLVYAFVSEVLRAIKHPAIAPLLEAPVLAKLGELIAVEAMPVESFCEQEQVQEGVL